MPIYEYECKKCGDSKEVFYYVKDMAQRIACECGDSMDKVISMHTKPVVLDYYDETLGARVTGPRQQKQLMRNHPLKLEFK